MTAPNPSSTIERIAREKCDEFEAKFSDELREAFDELSEDERQCWRDEMLIDLSRLRPGDPLPNGLVAVPAELTPAMDAAARKFFWSKDKVKWFADFYRAILAAAGEKGEG